MLLFFGTLFFVTWMAGPWIGIAAAVGATIVRVCLHGLMVMGLEREMLDEYEARRRRGFR